MSLPPLPFKVKTNVSWPGEEDGDLGFIENEIIEVYSIVDESWWTGKLRRNNAEGIFPKEYVDLIDDKYFPRSSSKSSLNNGSKPHTPVKDHGDSFRSSKNNYYSTSKINGKKTNPLNNPNASFDYEDDYSYDTSFDYDRRRFRKLSPSPKLKLKYSSHDDLREKEREREIENFRLLQQQQHYHIKKQQHVEQKRLQDKYRNSIDGVGQSFAYSKHKSKLQRPHSQYIHHGGDLMSSSNEADAKHNSYSDFTEIKQQMTPTKYHSYFQNNTIESFSPETSPAPQKRRNNNVGYMQEPFSPIGKENPLYEHEELEKSFDDELATTKRRLELELQRIKNLEKKKKMALSKSPQSNFKGYNDQVVENSGNSSYISEDLLSSKKNYQSKDDLGKKLSNYVTDEEADYHYDDDVDDDEPSSPPPPPPKRNIYGGERIPFDSDDFKYSVDNDMTEEEKFRYSQLQQEHLKNSIKSLQSDVLNLSELSATSAGSFMRHKYEKQLQFNESKLKGLSIEEDEPEEAPKLDRSVMESVFEDKKKPNFLLKFLKKKGNENLLEQKLQKDDEINWTTFKAELNRMNSLTTQDKQQRTRRITKEEAKLIIKPLDYVSDINVNETVGEIEDDDQIISDFLGTSFSKAEKFIANYNINGDFNELISDISVKFNASKVNQLRCVLLHLCKFRIIEESSKIKEVKPKLAEILQKGEGTIYQINYLFKKVLDALRIPSELVLGFWKKPNEFYHIEQFVVNHCWLSVLLEGKIYIMDILCYKSGSICNLRGTSDKNYNEHYFLTKPLSVISTHIPSCIDLQHVVPPVDQTIAFYLPRVYSGFHKNRLNFRNYNNALTRLKDLEIFELELDIPCDVELFTLIKTAKITTNDLSLCQIFWSKNKRIAKIKAVLPEKESIGVLQIFAGEKGLQKHFDNIHELAIVIPLYHTGNSKAGKFVPRFPTVQSQNNDIYIKHPQTNKIIAKSSYNFEIVQHPSMGINSGSGLMNKDFKIVIESPSGKYYKLTKEDSLPFGTYQTNVKCQEVGVYRGLVIGDSGNSWYVFAQWDCVAGTITN